MPIANSHAHYGSLAKIFHWMTALLILTAFPLGIIAQKLPFDTNAELALKATMFSAHKTVGILAFLTALLRILWAISQKRPGLLNSENKLESTAAETAHWLLYGSMLAVPLTGWIHHASTEGFAPIWLPIGQNLPLVPKSEALAAFTASLHFILIIVLGLTILAHIGGALKHFIIDKDQTLQRMLPGRTPSVEVAPDHRSFAPFAIALAIWAGAMGIGTFGGAFTSHDTSVETAELSDVVSDWNVTEGTISIEITQFGGPVTGSFADWTAQISFDEKLTEGPLGNTVVEIAIGSLSLGSVTQQAMGADFFDVAGFPTAQFSAEIFADPNGDEQYLAQGTVTLKGVSVPVTLPFQLAIDQNIATMRGQTSLNRQDFGIGDNMPDETNLGFGVEVVIELTAERS
ncbi:MAG: cytochrome b/b6 domain-containing protein [Cognatishimia sp.]|uniref:cytochrome b/b6 domain-containing protein n=1 Tax=Cognatishimia sp. TaxID=2211648 RepID=UPI003B8DBBE1